MSTLLENTHKLETVPLIKPKGRIEELDGLRAVAITMVIGAHYPIFGWHFDWLAQFGWAGVNIFFVLSGYLITTILLGLKGKPQPYRTFFIRRARRILPPYFLVVATCLIFELLITRRFDVLTLLLQATFVRSFLGSGELLRGIASSVTGATPAIFNHARVGGTKLVNGAFLTIALSPTWSLSVEEWFYILWAPIVLAFRRSFAVAVIAFSVASAFLFRWLGQSDFLTLYQNFFCQTDMLVIGAALALWLQSHSASSAARRHGDRLVSAAGAISVLLLGALLTWLHPNDKNELREFVSFATFGLPLLSVATVSAIAWVIRHSQGKNLICHALRLPLAVWVGRRSYMLYLVHLPIYWFLFPLFRYARMPHLLLTSAVCSLSLSIVAVALSWEIIEAPLLQTPIN